MKPRAIIFFDLDGTLLVGPNQIDESSLEAIKLLRQAGYLPVIATGRARHEIESVLEQTGIEALITMNGQYVVNANELIYSNPLKVADMNALKEAALSKNYNVTYYSDAEITSERADDQWTELNYQSLHSSYPQHRPQLYTEKEIYLMLLMTKEPDPELLTGFPQFSFLRNTPYGYDVVPKGASKAVGILQFIEQQGFEGIPTYAFGDGINDMEMFKLVDKGVAMGNAVAPLKEIAHHVTDDFKQSGIYNGLKHYGLI